MKKIATRAALLALALLLSLTTAGAQESPDADKLTSETVFASFTEVTAKLKSRLEGRSFAQAMSRVVQIEQSVGLIKEEVKSGALFPVPEQYLKSLALNVELLQETANESHVTSAQKSRMNEALQTVAADLAVKAEHLTHRNKGPALVEVTVRARPSDGKGDGFEVWYVPKGWSKHSHAYKKFDQLTSNSLPPKMFLAPGNYFVWLTKPSVTTERKPLSIGGDGRAKREIEMLVP